MITKELLCGVLDLNVTDDGYFVISNDNKYVSIFQDKADFEPDVKINIHELAHKCKEWALKKYDISMYSYCHTDNDGAELIPRRKCTIINSTKKVKADTEAEAVFKACQWILDNK